MATKLRLQRHGRKRKPFFHIVAADTRSKRDGRIVERFGSYDPTTNPATIEMDFDRALYWVKAGAETTDTCRAILSYKGVLMKNHLDKGVAKGALTEKQAEAKFEAWMKEKESKIQSKSEKAAKAKDSEAEARLKAEAAVNEARENARKEAEAAAHAEAEAAAQPPVEETPAEEEAPAAEAAPAEEAKAEEAPAAEAKAEEPKAEEAKEEDKKDA